MSTPEGLVVWDDDSPSVDVEPSTRFTWRPRAKVLSTEPKTTAEDLSALLETGFVDGMTSLKIASDSKKLTHLPEPVNALVELVELHIESPTFDGWGLVYGLEKVRSLSVGEVTELPDGIASMSALEELNIKSKKLGRLPSDLGEIPMLQSLKVVSAKVTELPPLGSSLRQLKLSWTKKLKALPEGMEALCELESITTDSVPLTSLPEGLGKLPKLRSLLLQRSKVKKLPSEIDWPALEELDLHSDTLKKWPKKMAMPKLRRARLGGKFKTLPPFNPDALEKLECNAPLEAVDPALASVAKLKLQCAAKAMDALSDAEREAFGTRLRATWK